MHCWDYTHLPSLPQYYYITTQIKQTKITLLKLTQTTTQPPPMESDADTPPFWSQPQATALVYHRNRRQPSPFFNPVALILAVPILLLLLLFFILPPFLSHANNFIRPSSVKKGWDYFNIVLVLFAIFCGFFAKRNDEASDDADVAVSVNRRNSESFSTVSTFVNEPRQSVSTWLEFLDRKDYKSSNFINDALEAETPRVRLRRSSTSYPDLRQETLWDSGDGNRSRFFDDFEVNFYRSPPRESLRRRRRQPVVEVEEEGNLQPTPVREIPVDKFEVSSAPPPQKYPPPPPPPPAEKLKQRHTFHSVPEKEMVEEQQIEAEISEDQPPAPPLAPPSPPPAMEPEFRFPVTVSENVRRKRSSAKKEITTAIVWLYKGQKRKRKKKVKNRDIHESAPQNSSSPSAVEPQSTPAPPPPPPPPPPLPPSKVLQNLFKKSSKTKRVHSVPTTGQPPPPPPPPPPNSIFNNLFKTGTKSKRFQAPSDAPTPPPPPPPPPSSILNSLFKNGTKSFRFKNFTTPPPPPPPPQSDTRRRRETNSGRPPKPPKQSNQYTESVLIAPPSPLIPMPPPLPPFRMREVKFVTQGDFVQIRSEHSSQCSSPDREDFDAMSVKSDAEDLIGTSVTCPSPDVNTKADNFIARLRGEWRLEKINSYKEKQTSGL